MNASKHQLRLTGYSGSLPLIHQMLVTRTTATEIHTAEGNSTCDHEPKHSDETTDNAISRSSACAHLPRERERLVVAADGVDDREPHEEDAGDGRARAVLDGRDGVPGVADGEVEVEGEDRGAEERAGGLVDERGGDGAEKADGDPDDGEGFGRGPAVKAFDTPMNADQQSTSRVDKHIASRRNYFKTLTSSRGASARACAAPRGRRRGGSCRGGRRRAT